MLRVVRVSGSTPFQKFIGSLIVTGIDGAEGGTRTPTSYLTRPSNVRVCQFRHFGIWVRGYYFNVRYALACREVTNKARGEIESRYFNDRSY